MQQAIPYKSWLPLYTTNNPLNLNLSPVLNNNVPKEGNNDNNTASSRNMGRLLSENAVIVLASRGCCMSHVVKRLLLELGVNPPVYEIDEGDDEVRVLEELKRIVAKNNDKLSGTGNGGENKNNLQFPAVFIGGKLFGGLDRLMATHISGELVPILKQAGALWL